MNNMQQIIQQAKKMQAKMTQKQSELENVEVNGTAAGKVNITLTVSGNMKKIEISKDVVDPDDISMLEDLVLSAFDDAKKKAEQKYSEAMSEFNLPMPGMPGLF